ncbi:hypothetical protein HNP21_005867 [Bacillus aryabhattai]|uniref:Uncharacterized protein n=1 Tax=Priestia aryabhattai TaxID=412384 RepID=A0A7W3NGS4_PRIAR|nr:hypothetical protein [Priestia aryabhattai]
MTGNLSRTVLRGAGARESACLPDLTTNVYIYELFLVFITGFMKARYIKLYATNTKGPTIECRFLCMV